MDAFHLQFYSDVGLLISSYTSHAARQLNLNRQAYIVFNAAALCVCSVTLREDRGHPPPVISLDIGALR
jgi:hypothetical protein